MDGRRARLVDRPVLDNLPTVTTSAAAEPTHHTERRLTTGWAAILGVGWPVALMIGFALEPTPAHPHAPVPLLVELGSHVLVVALLATAVTAARRHPVAAVMGVVTGLVAVAFSVTCPVSGHHGFGLWWVAQLAVMLTMLATSVAALRPHSRTPA
jgi:hypothetical protein